MAYLGNEPDVITTAETVINTANDGNNETVFLVFSDTQGATTALETDVSLTYNPSTNLLTTAGAGIGTDIPSGALTISADSSTTNNRALHLTITDDDPTAATTATYIDYNVTGATATGGDTNHIALRVDTNSSATGGDTTDEHRVFGIYNSVDVSGDSDLVYGHYNDMRVSHSEGTISVLYGNYTLLESDNSGGTVATAAANRNLMYVNGTGNTTNAYADFNVTLLQNPSTVTNAFGSYHEVQLEANSTVSTVYGVRSVIDENGGSSTNEYLFHGSYEGTPSGSGYGLYIDGETKNYISGAVGIGTTSPSDTLTVAGTGNFSGNVTASHFVGTATEALYADLAENYQADDTYEPGTVLVFGGSAEVTATNKTHDTRVAGVVSTNPAYLMNKDSGNTSLGLTGRLPCLVKGPVDKGTLLVTSTTPGVAQALNDAYYKPGCVIGKSMNTLTDSSIELIEIAVGRF